jgi:hypothetical protein
LKSLFNHDQALRLKLSADPRLWSWVWLFLMQCTSERARVNGCGCFSCSARRSGPALILFASSDCACTRSRRCAR